MKKNLGWSLRLPDVNGHRPSQSSYLLPCAGRQAHYHVAADREGFNNAKALWWPREDMEQFFHACPSRNQCHLLHAINALEWAALMAWLTFKFLPFKGELYLHAYLVKPESIYLQNLFKHLSLACTQQKKLWAAATSHLEPCFGSYFFCSSCFTCMRVAVMSRRGLLLCISDLR